MNIVDLKLNNLRLRANLTSYFVYFSSSNEKPVLYLVHFELVYLIMSQFDSVKLPISLKGGIAWNFVLF